MSEQHPISIPFESLGLASSLMEGIREAGFERCTPIQAETLPIALSGRDVAGQAQTGTGKTAAFLIALFHALTTRPPAHGRAPSRPFAGGQAPGPDAQFAHAPPQRGALIRALVVAPTRELAVQIHHDAEILGRHTGLKLALVFGGTDYEKQRRQFAEGADVLIGTPGRIIDYYKQHVFDLRHVQVLVLDEADRMFDLGFIADIRYILRRLPPPERRQSMLFSATLSYRVLELAYEHMAGPELVRIDPDKRTVDEVRQSIYYPAKEEKIPLLVTLLRRTEARRTLVFTNTKRNAEHLERVLRANGFKAQAISGDVPQNKRLQFLRNFHDGQLAVLIATDVASRGLHIPDVSHVFNFDLPQDPGDYVHRIGRTARAGAEGDAISFACEEFALSLPDIEHYLGHKIPTVAITPDLLSEPVVAPRASHGEHSGGPARRPGQARRSGRTQRSRSGRR